MQQEGYLSYNRYTNLDGIEWRVIDLLVNSKTKHSENLWKMLAYPTEDCLLQEPLTAQQKYDLIYTDNGLSSDKRVFMMPFVDDAWVVQASRLDIFVSRITPKNHIISNIDIGIEIVVHNKINNILGEADLSYEGSNPSELSPSGELLIPYKSRSTAMLKSLLAELNGAFVNGVGTLQHNAGLSPYNATVQTVWNNRAYIGYALALTTQLSGVSDFDSSTYLGKGY